MKSKTAYRLVKEYFSGHQDFEHALELSQLHGANDASLKCWWRRTKEQAATPARLMYSTTRYSELRAHW